MHNKTEKFITQLHYAEKNATQTREVSKYQLISQSKLSLYQRKV